MSNVTKRASITLANQSETEEYKWVKILLIENFKIFGKEDPKEEKLRK